MLKNYFKVACRNLGRNKLLSIVNIAGLAIGLACVMLILLFVNDEWSFDRFHENGQDIYRLVQTTTDTSGQQRRSGNTGLPHGPVFAAEVPEIAAYCRVQGWDMTTRNGKEGLMAKVMLADPSIFSIFSLDVLKGNTQHLLDGRNTVVLTDDAAVKYFGKDDPIGKTIDIEVDEALESFQVTGMIKTPPLNSSIQFELLIPFQHQLPTDAAEMNQRMSNWNNLYLNNFFLLRKGANPVEVEKKLLAVYQQHNKQAQQATGQQAKKSAVQFGLQPLFDMHLDTNFFASNGLSNWSDASYSYILSGLALLILLVACINFINIALAKGLQRSKEIGIRKVSGSSRAQVIAQFLSESLLVTLVAFVAALLLVYLAIPVFNSISNKQFGFTNLVQPITIVCYIGLILIVAFLAGFYPALVASGFQPVQILYGRLKLSGNHWFGNALVVLQFVIAVGLIIGTIVFNLQFDYISKTDLGYNPRNMMYLQFPWDRPKELQQLKNELAKDPAIQLAGTKSGNWNKTVFTINGKQTDWTYYENIDDQYLQTLQIPLAAGRYLSYNNPADTISNCIINQAFADAFLGKTTNPVGQQVAWQNQQFTVAGVVKNYHSANLKEKIEPIFFSLDTRGDLLNTYVKYVPGKEQQAAAAIAKAYHNILPFATLELYNMQDWLLDRYAEDAQWKKIITVSAVIAILISALGLFALTALAVQQRVKEIGIRKVLGASVLSITALLSRSFVRLVAVALCIAAPLAWWLMNNWLQDFAYRIQISWWVFLVAGAGALLLAIITVSIQAIRAAVANPVKSLRTV